MELNVGEALRYLGVREDPDGSLHREMARVAENLTRTVQLRYVYRVFPAIHTPDGVVLQDSGVTLTGGTARQMLAQCSQAALLVCTLGAQFEALLRAGQARDMTRAVMLDACGSAWVEAGCGAAEQELAARYPELYLTDRFSPGYGDLPLDLQPAICASLDAWRRLGVQVTASLLMNPTKSVTAVIGLSDHPQPARIRGCEFCSMADTCTLRKGGTTCASGLFS